MRRFPRLILTVLPVLALAACGGAAIETGPVSLQAVSPPTVPPATPAVARPETFLGRVDNSDAFVAVLSDGASVTAYVCDGKAMASWFRGRQQGDTVALVDDEGEHLNAEIHQGSGGAQLSRGSLLDEAGQTHDLFASRSTDVARTGLYRATVEAAPGHDAAASPTVGVIVLATGEFRGAYYANDKVTPVTDAQINANSLTAIVPGVGSFEAARLSAPLQGRAGGVTLHLSPAEHRRADW